MFFSSFSVGTLCVFFHVHDILLRASGSHERSNYSGAFNAAHFLFDIFHCHFSLCSRAILVCRLCIGMNSPLIGRNWGAAANRDAADLDETERLT